MTLEEQEPSAISSFDFSVLTRNALLHAKDEKRLICGLEHSARYLETDPLGVEACVLPLDCYSDVTNHIYYMLIEAFCNENAIALLKVDCCAKLFQLLKHTKFTYGTNSIGRVRTPQDCFCILMLKSWRFAPRADAFTAFIDQAQQSGSSLPEVVLPVDAVS